MPTKTRKLSQSARRGSKTQRRTATQKIVQRRGTMRTVGAREFHVFKISISDMEDTFRERRRNAYIHYARNAKFMMRLGAIPHLRIYNTLKSENELYSDFCRNHPDLGKLRDYFVSGGWVTERQLRSQDHAHAEKMKQMERDFDSDVEYLLRRTQIEKDRADMAETVFKEKMEYQNAAHELNMTRMQNTISHMQNIVQLLETQLRDKDVVNNALKAELEAVGAEKEALKKTIDLRDDTIEQLQKAVDAMEERIRKLYVYEMAQAGWEYVSGIFTSSYEYMKEAGRKADEELKQARKDRITRRQRAQEAERILREMNEEAERLAKEMERARKEAEERAQKAREEAEEEARKAEEKLKAEAKARKSAEAKARARAKSQQRTEQQQNNRTGANTQSARVPSGLQSVYQQALDVKADTDTGVENCPALRVHLADVVVPSCKSTGNRKRILAEIRKSHPDKNLGCPELAKVQSQYLNGLSAHHDKLADC
jgi:hypothetical protein